MLAMTTCNGYGTRIDGPERWICKWLAKHFVREQHGHSAVLAVEQAMNNHSEADYTCLRGTVQLGRVMQRVR
jgi:hypothetical protein